MTRDNPDLGNASDWSCRVGNFIQPIRSTTQIWVVTRHQYFCACFSDVILAGKPVVASPKQLRFLFWALNAFNELLEVRFTFPFNLISTSTLAFFTANQGAYSNLGTQLGKENKDSLSQPNLTRIQFRLWRWLVEKSNKHVAKCSSSKKSEELNSELNRSSNFGGLVTKHWWMTQTMPHNSRCLSQGRGPEVQPLTLLYTTINRKGTPFEDLVFCGPDQPNLIPRVPSYSELERTLVATKLVSPLAHKNTSK